MHIPAWIGAPPFRCAEQHSQTCTLSVQQGACFTFRRAVVWNSWIISQCNPATIPVEGAATWQQGTPSLCDQWGPEESAGDPGRARLCSAGANQCNQRLFPWWDSQVKWFVNAVHTHSQMQKCKVSQERQITWPQSAASQDTQKIKSTLLSLKRILKCCLTYYHSVSIRYYSPGYSEVLLEQLENYSQNKNPVDSSNNLTE